MVVDFTVEDNLKRSVPICHGLVSRRQINDAEAAMREADLALYEKSRVIGATVLQDIAHADEYRFAYAADTPIAERDTANAAHSPRLH
jgi:hypothetical protein